MANSKIKDTFFKREDTHQIAKELLGKILVKRSVDGKIKAGYIVETESYHGFNDKASHAAKARTPRTEVMFGSGGYYYVYFIYGMYWNLNIVAGKKEFPSAILIRALEPIFDSNINLTEIDFKDKFKIASGPGKLCRWMEIDSGFYGKSVENDELFIANDFQGISSLDGFKVVETKRIGVDYAGDSADLHWRYYIKGNRFVSKI